MSGLAWMSARWRRADAESRLGLGLLGLALLLPLVLPTWQVAEFARYFCYMLFARVGRQGVHGRERSSL